LTNRGEHGERLVTPDLGLHIDVQLNLIPVGILDVERMGNRMVACSRDEHPGRLTRSERGTEFVVAGADFQTEVVHPDSVASAHRLSVMTNLNEEQFVMGPSGAVNGKRSRNSVKLIETEHVSVEGSRSL
jgi:hypothetical protein